MRTMFPEMKVRHLVTISVVALLLAMPAIAQTCSTGADLDAAGRNSMEKTAHSIYDYVVNGDFFHLKANSIAQLANAFDRIQQAVIEYKPSFAGAQPTLMGMYLLDASSGSGTLKRAEFYCGIFNSPDRVGFIFNNLPAGKYGMAVVQAQGPTPMLVGIVLQVENNVWKLAGLYLHPTAVNGHDGNWYLQQARSDAAKGDKDVAFLYFGVARELIAPVDFMTDPQLEKLDDDAEAVAPPTIPLNGPVTITGPDGKNYQVTVVRPQVTKDGLRLMMRQQVPDATNTGASTVQNIGLIKAAVLKWPEVRDNFGSVLAIAQDTQQHEYGTVLKMSDIK